MRLRQKQLVDQEARMRRRIVRKIQERIREYVEKKGYLLVMDSSALGAGGVETVVYNSETIDITAEILKVIGSPPAGQEE